MKVGQMLVMRRIRDIQKKKDDKYIIYLTCSHRQIVTEKPSNTSWFHCKQCQKLQDDRDSKRKVKE